MAAARSLLERAQNVRERTLGRDHHDTLHSVYSLGSLLRDQGY